MTNVSRLDQELADALGLAQAVRGGVSAARGAVTDRKVLKRLDRIETDLDDVQERVNAAVVADAPKRAQLTSRSRAARDTEAAGAPQDGIDALQALAGHAAHHLAQWMVIERLAKDDGDKRARRLAKRAVPAAEAHLRLTLKSCRRLAKRAPVAA